MASIKPGAVAAREDDIVALKAQVARLTDLLTGALASVKAADEAQGGLRTTPEETYPILKALAHEETVVVEGARDGGTSTGVGEYLARGERSRPIPLSIARALVDAGHAVIVAKTVRG